MKSFATFLTEQDMKALPGTQYGSNPGGIHVDTNGERHYVKFYRNPDQAKTEALAGKLYSHLGVDNLNPEFRKVNGRDALVTKWNDNLQSLQPREFERLSPQQQHQIGRHFHAAVLTKNWDAVGLEHDNIMRDKTTGSLHSVDLGGAFHFRAQGGPKEYGADIDEVNSLRKPNRPSGHVFNSNFKNNNVERNSLDKVRSLDMDAVHRDFQNSGLSNWQELHDNFVSRRQALLDHYDNT